MLEHVLDSLPGDERRLVGEHLRARVHQDLEGAVEGSKQIAKENQNVSYERVDGLGELSASIDSRSYAYWQQREPGCWGDAQFRREYLRDNPEARVSTRSGKIQVGYSGESDGFIRHRVGRKIKAYK